MNLGTGLKFRLIILIGISLICLPLFGATNRKKERDSRSADGPFLVQGSCENGGLTLTAKAANPSRASIFFPCTTRYYSAANKNRLPFSVPSYFRDELVKAVSEIGDGGDVSELFWMVSTSTDILQEKESKAAVVLTNREFTIVNHRLRSDEPVPSDPVMTYNTFTIYNPDGRKAYSVTNRVPYRFQFLTPDRRVLGLASFDLGLISYYVDGVKMMFDDQPWNAIWSKGKVAVIQRKDSTLDVVDLATLITLKHRWPAMPECPNIDVRINESESTLTLFCRDNVVLRKTATYR